MITNYDVFKGAILLIFLRIVCAESGKCPTNYWPCKNDQCIRNEEVCDGPIHCKDGSDETAEQCLLIPCPSYAFQCAYGGCITGNFKCNDFKDCADGSDESKFLCNTDLNFEKEIQGTCKKSQMQCKTGECISSNDVCDGKKHCPDGSDETVDLCSHEKCPHKSFRCGYGACIRDTAKCNLMNDCLDGSDELSNVCALGYRPNIHTDITEIIDIVFPVNSTDTETVVKPHMNVFTMHASPPEPECISYEIPNYNIINSTNYCPLFYWSCNDRQCIRNEEVCDGTPHCEDGSDETVAQCLDVACPSFAFRCAYGACITGNFKCNGIADCKDGSDENKYMCNKDLDYAEDIQGPCRLSAMECKSGDCIDNELVCDGKKQCPDGSDETVELCSNSNCPPYAFRCGYGACIAGSAKCNGNEDCMDGSDELYSLCGPSCKPNISTNATTEDKDDDISNRTPMVTTTERSTVINKYCSAHTLRSGISTQKSCFFNKTSVSCYHNLRPGTRANITCATGYVEKHPKKKHHFVKCENNGEWNNLKMKCIAECGTLTEDQKLSAIKPWDLSIFKRNHMGLFVPICSGVIVSPKVVLTAAKCMMNHNDNSYVKDHVVYNVIPGFYNKTYSQGDDLNVEVHNISQIDLKTPQRTEGVAVLILVNYFEFSINLKPICLPTIANDYQVLSDNNLNIGRPVLREDSRIHLEFLTANTHIEHKNRLANYVNVYRFLPFINRQINSYDYLL